MIQAETQATYGKEFALCLKKNLEKWGCRYSVSISLYHNWVSYWGAFLRDECLFKDSTCLK